MKIEVEMLAFEDEGQVRVVDVPDEEWSRAGSHEHKLDLVFKYGQNDFQPQKIYSVSVGDVVHLGGKRFRVGGCGWNELTEGQYKEYLSISRRDRHFYLEP